VLKPSSKAIQGALQHLLGLPDAPRRIECFDISHIRGPTRWRACGLGRRADEKSDYRKFIIRDVAGNDDFASMREVIGGATRG